MLETSRSSANSRRHSRRSTGNINFAQTSFSPLTSTSITDQDFKRSKELKRRSGSYIQGISAPTTPGILSRAPSFQRTPSSPGLELSKSKSSSDLTRNESSKSQEWMQRTGAALTSETRESKGQSWLSARESSISLIRLDIEVGNDYVYGADDEFSPGTPMWGRSSEYDYMDTGVEGALYGEAVVSSDEEDMDFERGFGFGQLIDRVIGWSLFAEDESSESENEDLPAQLVRERITLSPLGDERLEHRRQRRDQDEGWQDPAWIFSIASNVLF